MPPLPENNLSITWFGPMKSTKNDTKPKTALQLLIEAGAKKRFRPSPALKAWAQLLGLKLRGRGRPPKATANGATTRPLSDKIKKTRMSERPLPRD
jgi:hypothetical protein